MVTGKEILCESCRFSFGTELYNIDRCIDCGSHRSEYHYQRDVNKERVFEEEEEEVVKRVIKKGRKSKK